MCHSLNVTHVKLFPGTFFEEQHSIRKSILYCKAILLVSVLHLGSTVFISTRVKELSTLEQNQYFPLLKGGGGE